MSAPLLERLPRLVVFGLYGAVAGLLVALTVGELVWWLVRPAPPPALALVAKPEVDRVRPPERSTSARLAVTASPRVSLYPGGANTVAVRVARDRFDGPVMFQFTGRPGVRAADITVRAGETGGAAQITATATAKPGDYRLAVTATAVTGGEVLTATATVEVTILPPPGAPRLALGVSPRVQAYQRGKNTFAVKIARADFDDEVTVTFDRLPDGVTVPPVVIPAGQTEATAELTAEGSTAVGRHVFAATARGGPKAPAAAAVAEVSLDVLASPKLPVDVVLVLDFTGSMRKVVPGLSGSLKKLGAELAKAQLDARFALVGFQDTTLGQPLKVPRLGDERTTADVGQLAAAVARVKLGGGGGEGSSSLDGLAEAADGPFREPTTRVLLLVTDDGPKRIDGRMKGTADAVKYLREKKIDQVHVAALPEHRKPFEPVLEVGRGKFFDLKAATAADDFDKLATDLGRAVWESLPERPETKPVPSGPAVVPPLPPPGSARPSALPPGAEPDEPKLEPRAAPVAEIPAEEQPASKGRKALAAVAWVVAVAALVCSLLLVGQLTFLPGGRPSVGVGAIGYGSGFVVGLIAAPLGYSVLEAVGGAFAGRLAAGCGLGLGVGLLVPLPQLLLRREPEPQPEPLELDDEPPAPAPPVAVAVPVAPVVKPNITPPKPADGCPGCGRQIPGAVGARYCMVCDNTF